MHIKFINNFHNFIGYLLTFFLNYSASSASGYFRGAAASLRSGLRVVGQQRTLAFASEGAVAGEALIPRPLYFGLWGLSGLAIVGDITTKVFDAPEEKRKNTAIYQTAFHIPASLVVPAVIIHQVVHGMQYSMKNHGYAKSFPPRVKALIPVCAALASIFPVVPVVDHTFEFIMEPTLGKYLELEFPENDKKEH